MYCDVRAQNVFRSERNYLCTVFSITRLEILSEGGMWGIFWIYVTTLLYAFCNRLHFLLSPVAFLRCTVRSITSPMHSAVNSSLRRAATRPHLHKIVSDSQFPVSHIKLASKSKLQTRKGIRRRCHAYKVTSRNKTTCVVMSMNHTGAVVAT